MLENFFSNYDESSLVNLGMMGGTISLKNLIFKHEKFNEILYIHHLKLKAAQLDDFNMTVSWKNI